MSHLPKPTVENFREFKDYPTIASAVSRGSASSRRWRFLSK